MGGGRGERGEGGRKTELLSFKLLQKSSEGEGRRENVATCMTQDPGR